MSDYVPTKHERESAEAREALWNALGRRPDELFAIASALTAAEERGRRRGVEEAAKEADVLAAGNLAHDVAMGGPYALALVARKIRALAPRDPAPEAAPGCLCQGGKTQPYCAYCLGMSAPRDSGKGAK